MPEKSDNQKENKMKAKQKKKSPVDKQQEFAQDLLEMLQADYGDSLEDVDALSILDAMGCIGISFTDQSFDASLAYLEALGAIKK